jgi:hypothetical protein
MHGKMDMAELCKKHINKYVLIQTTDGMQYDGIVADVDGEHVVLAVPAGGADFVPPHARAFAGFGGYPYGWGVPFGYGPYFYPYGYGGRFRRLVLPLAALAAISLLPYF